MADHLLDLPLAPKVFGDIGVLFGSLFVDDFDGHLRRHQEHGHCQTLQARMTLLRVLTRTLGKYIATFDTRRKIASKIASWEKKENVTAKMETFNY